MRPFTFQTTPSVLFEPGAAKKIAGLVSEFGAKRVLFVTDKGVRGAGLTQDAEASLAAEAAPFSWTVFGLGFWPGTWCAIEPMPSLCPNR